MKPKLLDAFSGAGGACRGYQLAGFEVTGVDIAPQPHYVGEHFLQADALEMLADAEFVSGFDAVHASPPCQFHTTLSSRWRKGTGTVADSRVNLLTTTLELLRPLSIPWVVENVEGAAPCMNTTIRLHGGMFGLGVHRPRLFESNIMLMSPKYAKAKDHRGVYGRAPDGRKTSKSSECYAVSSLEEAQERMGMDWGDWHGVKEAIPPAYSFFIGQQLMAHLEVTSCQ